MLGAVLAACAAPRPQPPRGEEVLRVDGRVENAPFRFGVDDLPTLPRRAFESADATGRGTPHRYEGVAVDALLSDRMELKQGADTAVVHGERGLAVPVPLSLLRQLRPVLAADVRGGGTAATRGDAPVSLVLAWPVTEHPGIETDPRLRWWWVPGVRRVEISAWLDTYGRALRVPAGAPDGARLGADVLGAQCMGCHAVRGVGGTRGPPLTDGATRARLRRPFEGHLREVSGSASAPTITHAMASHVAAFLDAVDVAGPDRDAASDHDSGDSSRPPEEPPIPEPPGTAPPGAAPPVGGGPPGR